MTIPPDAMNALDSGNIESLKKWLARDRQNLHLRADNGETLLHKASFRGNVQLMKFLIEAGLSVAAVDSGGFTPLHEAARGGQYAAAVYLIEIGAKIDARTSNGKTPEDLAKEKSPELADMISQGGANPRWVLSGKEEVTLVSPRHTVGYRLTEIFNFGAQSYVLITRNMTTNTESAVMKTFNDLAGTPMVERAEAALARLGGVLPEGYSPGRLDKPRSGGLSGRNLS